MLLRIFTTRLYALGALIFLFFMGSSWEKACPAISDLLFFIGLVLAAVASMGRLWCSVYIAGYKDAKLIQKGPYSMCRNPLYFFSLIGAIGVGLTTETITVPLVLGLSFLAYYPLVIKKEEQKLAKLFPDEFTSYCQRVPRLFPRNLNVDEPNTYEMNPRLFRHHMFSALWFIWGIGVLEMIEAVHELHVVPIYWQLY